MPEEAANRPSQARSGRSSFRRSADGLRHHRHHHPLNRLRAAAAAPLCVSLHDGSTVRSLRTFTISLGFGLALRSGRRLVSSAFPHVVMASTPPCPVCSRSSTDRQAVCARLGADSATPLPRPGAGVLSHGWRRAPRLPPGAGRQADSAAAAGIPGRGSRCGSPPRRWGWRAPAPRGPSQRRPSPRSTSASRRAAVRVSSHRWQARAGDWPSPQAATASAIASRS